MNLSKVFVSFVALSGIAIASSCQREVEVPESTLHEVVFHAGWDPETRTVLQEDGSVWWSPGDEISLFVGDGYDYNGGYKLTATNSEPAVKADFVGQIGGNGHKYTAIYPYNDSNSVSDNILFFTIPTEQIAKEGAFADGALVSVAVSSGDNLFFKNLCSGIKFSVANDNINKVIIKSRDVSNSIAGQITVNISDPNNLVFESSGTASSIIVNAPDGECFKVGSYYFIPITPGAKNEGIEIEFYTTNNTVGTYRSHEPTEFKRAVVKRAYGKDKDLKFRPRYGTKITYVIFVVNGDKRTDI